ncbi:DNA polymerase Y family protein [Methylosinus sp. Sm6]|uniref:Y-family DNA polymerase n=1 Tax=Methylosinus sp. Sm6 TaxID=2866948 RepID=UPI001C99BCE1|nr:DNA polymerase Y family protein [Methylosinus sp. Sm6]MBY6241055.1 DNA polymerase Y family protein [Methylosinus sp. Sm6]
MRCLAVFLPRLPTDRILRACARSDADAPFAVFAAGTGGDRLTAVDARAERAGLVPGMAVADARAMRPALRLAAADAAADAALLGKIADWCRRFTPLAAIDPPDAIVMDVSGAAHLFGGEAALLAEVERRLAGQGFAAQAALAPGPALAGALARFAPAVRAPRHVPAETPRADVEAIAARLPVAALRLDEPARRRMERAGLHRLGDLLSRPRAPLAARFGPDAMARLDAVACRRREPISPRFEAPDFMAERRFPEGLTRREDMERTLAALARELCLLLERHGAGVRHVAAEFYRVDGAVAHIETGTSRPLRDPGLLALLLRERLAVLAEEGLDTGYGFDVIRLGATRTERCATPQADLGLAPEESAGADLSDLVDRLGARLGLRRVLRLYPQASHIPEFAVAALPAAAPPPRTAARPDPPLPAPTRPLRLFERPEPIEAVALMPDGPPLRFRWRRALHELAAYEGPERIAPQWWSAPDGEETRDYFYVEDREGLRFWLFRKGLPGHECAHPRWFMHGLF